MSPILPPEIELLLCCARTHLGTGDAARIRDLLQRKIDWAYLVRTAFVQAVAPLLYWHLNATCPEAVPRRVLEGFGENFLWNVKHNLFLTGELHKILKQLQAHNIEAIPFKGPILAHSLYGNLALRPFQDLDILVKKQEAPRARDLLVSDGYRPQFQWTPVQEESFLGSQCQYYLEQGSTGAAVEIHWAFAPKYFSFFLDTETLWQRLEPALLCGNTIDTLSAEDLLLILCVHGAKHQWDRLIWICDVAEFLRVYESLDWDWVMRRASTLGGGRMLFLGLLLAKDLLGANLPPEVSQAVERDRGARRLASQVQSQLFKEDNRSAGVAESWGFQLQVRERLRDKLNYSLRYVLVPTVGDWEFLSLPKSLFFIHYFLRPLRVLGKYGLGLGQRSAELDLGGFEPTPAELIGRELELAEVGPGDTVYDLGCGDGRIVIRAAKQYGARGVGIDINPYRIAEAKAQARKEGVEHLVRFVLKDAKTVDPSPATAVVLYLPWAANLTLRPILQERLRPGARIISRGTDMGEWSPHRTEEVIDGKGATHKLYLWRIEKQSNSSRTTASVI